MEVITRSVNIAFSYVDIRLPFTIFQSETHFYITSNWSKRDAVFPLYISDSGDNMARFIVGFAMLLCNIQYASNKVGIRINQDKTRAVSKNIQTLLSIYANPKLETRSRFSFFVDFNVLINQAAIIIYGNNYNQVNNLGVYKILLDNRIWKNVDCNFLDETWDFV
ncbi:hypothetical protein BB560_002031 [Smittium megazygosporum]|uniref:Uncharacterized protein n=1 Tax=Smittium megazygosporum TaxID=133381 RepID=A0A2T9ZG29_9FUNG|nr:hypothetical protein BB560_002031 [Smittium megazygosporum]